MMARRAMMFAGLSLLVVAAAHGGDKVGPDTARDLVARGELLPLEHVLKLNRAELTGRIIAIELESKSHAYIYEIKMLDRDGRKIELKIDAQTGALLKSRR